MHRHGNLHCHGLWLNPWAASLSICRPDELLEKTQHRAKPQAPPPPRGPGRAGDEWAATDHEHCSPDGPFTSTPYALLEAGLTQKRFEIKIFPLLPTTLKSGLVGQQ